MSGYLFKYKVEAPPTVITAASLEAYLNGLGAQEWELIDVHVAQNFVILKQNILPPGCATLATLIVKAIFDAFGQRS